MTYKLADLNEKSQSDFTDAIGTIYEHSPWIPEEAWNARPFANISDLKDEMIKIVNEADIEKKLDLLRAHPDLGGRVKMTDESVQEQQGAGLDQLTEEEHTEVLSMNEQYTTKFGFPFIIAVKGHDKESIMSEMKKRVSNDREIELSTALEEIYKIAGFRLDDLVQTA